MEMLMDDNLMVKFSLWGFNKYEDVIWFVASNMNFIFHNIWDNPSR